MKQVSPAEIKDIAQYERMRPEFRHQIIALKKLRRVFVGPNVTFVFENHDTVRYQIQEMMRAERIVDDAAIQHEIDTYNSLLPDSGDLAATMMIELQDQTRIREEIARFHGVNTGECVWLQIGAEKLPGDFAAGQSDERRVSAVQYVRFHFNDAQRAAFRQTETPVSLVISHPHYQHEAAIVGVMRSALAQDFD